MKVYIAGPMTGYTDFNFPAFNEAEAFLRRLGYYVVNPVKLSEKVDVTNMTTEEAHEAYLAVDIPELKKCEAIFLLKGWHMSSGAKEELKTALEDGLKVYLEG